MAITKHKISIINKIKYEAMNSKKPLSRQFLLGAVISRFYFKVGRDKADPEKTVLPTILFINTNHEAFTDVRHRGFMLCFGWWDFAVKFGVFL